MDGITELKFTDVELRILDEILSDMVDSTVHGGYEVDKVLSDLQEKISKAREGKV